MSTEDLSNSDDLLSKTPTLTSTYPEAISEFYSHFPHRSNQQYFSLDFGKFKQTPQYKLLVDLESNRMQNGFVHLFKGPMTAGKTTRMIELYHRAHISKPDCSPLLIGYSDSHEVQEFSKNIPALEGGMSWKKLKSDRRFVGTHQNIVYPCWTGNNLYNILYIFLQSKMDLFADESTVISHRPGLIKSREITEKHMKELLPVFNNNDNQAWMFASLMSLVDSVGIDEGQFFPEIRSFCDLLASLGINVFVSALSSDFQMEAWSSISKLEAVCDKTEMLLAICSICKRDAPFTCRLNSSKEKKLVGGTKEYAPRCRRCFYI